MAGGRPSMFTAELTEEICRRIANGESLRRICLDSHMPDRITVFSWLLKPEYAEFNNQYVRARELQAENFADEMTDISDDGSNDYMETIDGETGAIVGYKLNGENIQRSRLRVDTRKWIASKLKPKKYGDKLELAGNADQPLTFVLRDMTKKD